MHYKLYRYQLSKIVSEDKEKPVHPDQHFTVFAKSRGKDSYGELAEYRGKKDSVLMYLRDYHYDFIGLIGRHSTEREVTSYNEREDETSQREVLDDDYPHAAFVCMPRLGMIACVDSAKVRADGAMSRLHQILVHRQKAFFVFHAITDSFDLRKAVKRFRVVDVTFEISPVNPHSGDLGLQLDQSRKQDHIRKIAGRATAPPSDPMRLDGGFLTSVQQLQQSGHAKVGFVGLTDEKIEVKVQKPGQATRLSNEDDESVFGEEVGVKINIPGEYTYPFSKGFVMQVRKIAKNFVSEDEEET